MIQDILDDIEAKEAEIGATIAKVERNDPRLVELVSGELRGGTTQARLIRAVERNTTLHTLNIVGTTWEIPGDWIGAFTKNITITKFITDTKRRKALPASVMKILDYYLQLNLTLKQQLNGMTAVHVSVRARKLRGLPPILFNSPNSAQITTLDVSGNKISDLPKDLTKLQSLVTLDASHNRLTSVIPEIGLLSNITQLNLSSNKIAVLPPSVGLLANLQSLRLDKNELKKLPLTLGDCLKMRDLHVAYNPFPSIPLEILAAVNGDPTQADVLLGYLRNLQKGSKRSYNMKLMFVGNGNVGKTTLLRSLTGQVQVSWMQRLAGSGASNNSVSKGNLGPNISTDGIDLCDWQVDKEFTKDLLPADEDNLVFSCWDFAGQEVYYTTHQFFLSFRSLYLVIFDLRYPEEEISKIEYWLQSIMSRTSNSPVIVIGTHCDDPKCTGDYIDQVLDQVEVRIKAVKCAKFVQAFAVVDSVSGTGTDTLRDKLIGLALEQPYMGEEIPQNYVSLQEKIKAIKETGRPTLTWDEFKALAVVDCRIAEADVVAATKFLQNLSVIIYFADEQLKNLVVIDPQFLVDIMATIFTTKNSFVRAGVLDHNALPHIWREPRFPAGIHPMLLNLLQRFEICFSFAKPGEVGLSLFPSLLPTERPGVDFIWPDDIHWLSDPSNVQHDRLFQLEFFPNGLFSRLMVRLLQITEPMKYWRHGLILTNPDGKNGEDAGGEVACVEQFPNEKALRVSVRGGKNPSKVLRMLVETFELLVSKWYNIKSFKRHIPCVHCLATEGLSKKPHLFSLEECEREASLGSSSMTCLKEGLPIRLDQIVPDVVLSDLETRRIDFSLVQIDKELAKGGFGIVYKGKYNDQVVAVKKLIIEHDEDEEEGAAVSKVFGEFRREVWVMSGLKHPNIVQLLGFCINPLAMVMEFVPSGTLYDFLAKNKTQPLDWPMRLKCASDIAEGMLFLHTLNPPLMHRDFKSPNIMLSGTTATSPIVCKVTDFGLSSQMWVESLKEKSSERDIANPTWLAPEVINETEYTVKSDVYSYGIILWEIVTRQHPFDEFKFQFMSQLEGLVTEGKRPTIPSDVLPDYAKLIEACWHMDPKVRPTFSEIVKILDKLIEQHAPHIPIPAKQRNMGAKTTVEEMFPPIASPPTPTTDANRAKTATRRVNETTFVKSLYGTFPVWCLCVHKDKVWTAHGPDPLASLPTTSQSAPTSPRSPPSSLDKAKSLSQLPPSDRSSHRVSYPAGTENNRSSLYLSPPPPVSRAPSSGMLLRALTSNNLFSSSEKSSSKETIVNLNEICIWDAQSGNLVGKIPEAHPAQILSMISVDSDVWSGAEDGTIKCWNMEHKNAAINTNDAPPAYEEENGFEGFLNKKAMNRFSQHWQRRWFVLKGNTLTRYKTSEEADRPKERIVLKGAEPKPYKKKYCIALTIKSSTKKKSENTELLVCALSEEEYNMWLSAFQACTTDKTKTESLHPDLVGDMTCTYGAVRCMSVVEGRVWAGTRGGVTAYNILEQRYTGAIKLQKTTMNVKGGDEMETQFVTVIVPHKLYVWCAIGPSIVRIDPKTRQMIDWFDGHTSFIDDMILFGDYLWTVSSADHTMRLWNTQVSPTRSGTNATIRKIGSVFENYDGQALGIVQDMLWIGGSEGVIRLWDPATKTVQKTLEKKHNGEITDIITVGKTVWVTSTDGSVSVWLLSG